MKLKPTAQELMAMVRACPYQTLFLPPSWRGQAPWPPIARVLEVYQYGDSAIDFWADKIEEDNAKGCAFLLVCRQKGLWALASTALAGKVEVRAERREASRRTERGEVSP